MRFLLVICSFLTLVPALYGQAGRIALKNGHVLKGDIQELPDGGYWVSVGQGSLKFDKDEVKSVHIESKRDKVQERFINSFRITPGQKSAARARVTPYENTIHKAAKKNKLDPALVKAVIRAESNFNPLDKSYKGACGLMQLMPGTARILGVKSIYSPEENIFAGTKYLSDMLYLFGGNVEKALAAYNAGPGAVYKYNRVPPYKETKNYIRNVFNYYKDYRKGEKVRSYTDDSGCLNIYNVQ